MYQNGYQQYKMQAVTTMTRGEMLLLLFDELLKRLSRAEMALKEQQYDLFDKSVQRAEDIVLYLERALNMQYPICRELRQMYRFFIYELSRIKAGRNASVIKELKPLVMELRDAFREASKKANI